jgi:hypothetical protein
LAGGVDPKFGIFDGEGAVSPRFNSERNEGRGGKKKGKTQAIHRDVGGFREMANAARRILLTHFTG